MNKPKTGSALRTATLTVCTYAPYVLMSIFAGAALMMFILGVAGIVLCLVSGQKLKQYRYSDP